MHRVSEFFRFYAPFSENMILNGLEGLFPQEFIYADGLLNDSRLRLYRSTGGKPYDINKLKYNFRNIESKLNHLTNVNFEDYSALLASSFEGMDGKNIITQDEMTVQPKADMSNILYNRIPRLDYQAYLPMPNADHAENVNGRLLSINGTEWLKISKDRGQFVFAVESTAVIWLDMNGWQAADPGATQAPDEGFAITFDEDRSLWYFWKDSQIIGVVDGNVQASNFRDGVPGDDVVYETVKAYMQFDETDHRIEFFCQTSENSAVRGVGYIDGTGMHDGAA